MAGHGSHDGNGDGRVPGGTCLGDLNSPDCDKVKCVAIALPAQADGVQRYCLDGAPPVAAHGDPHCVDSLHLDTPQSARFMVCDVAYSLPFCG